MGAQEPERRPLFLPRPWARGLPACQGAEAHGRARGRRFGSGLVASARLWQESVGRVTRQDSLWAERSPSDLSSGPCLLSCLVLKGRAEGLVRKSASSVLNACSLPVSGRPCPHGLWFVCCPVGIRVTRTGPKGAWGRVGGWRLGLGRDRWGPKGAGPSPGWRPAPGHEKEQWGGWAGTKGHLWDSELGGGWTQAKMGQQGSH